MQRGCTCHEMQLRPNIRLQLVEGGQAVMHTLTSETAHYAAVAGVTRWGIVNCSVAHPIPMVCPVTFGLDTAVSVVSTPMAPCGPHVESPSAPKPRRVLLHITHTAQSDHQTELALGGWLHTEVVCASRDSCSDVLRQR